MSIKNTEYKIEEVCLVHSKHEELNFRASDAVLHLAAFVHQMKGAPDRNTSK
jgi:hypothetical protein